MKHVQLKDLVGAWKLLYILRYNAPGFANHTNVVGNIVFTNEGYMSVVIQEPAGALPLPGTTVWKNATDSQLGNITRSLTAYCGKYVVYEVDEVYYTHTTLDVVMDPSWLKTPVQIRQANFSEWYGSSRMILTPVFNDAPGQDTLHWEKLDLPVNLTMA